MISYFHKIEKKTAVIRTLAVIRTVTLFFSKYSKLEGTENI